MRHGSRRAISALAVIAGLGAAAAVAATPANAIYCGRVAPHSSCSSNYLKTSDARNGAVWMTTHDVPKHVVLFDIIASGTADYVATSCVEYNASLRAVGTNDGSGSHDMWVAENYC
jgi:hypothetical protein